MPLNTRYPSKLRVVIIGAGIAGLSAAAFFRKCPQYDITVHERRGKDFKECSAALGVRINGISILKQLGINRNEIRAVMGAGYRTYNTQEEEMSKSQLGRGPDGDGTLWFVFRQDLKDVLLQRVTSEVGEGNPIKVLYGSCIVGVDPEAGVVEFEDGTSIIADLIIGADGIHSKVREAVIPSSHPAPVPCRGHEQMKIACAVPDSSLQSPSHRTPRVDLFQVRDQEASTHGANQALEDSEGINALFGDVYDRDNIPSLLRVWDSVRRPRASDIQRGSRTSQGKISTKEVSQAFLSVKPGGALVDSEPSRTIQGFPWVVVCVSLYVTCFLYGLDTTIAADVQGSVIAAFGHVSQIAWIGAGFPLGSVCVILFLGTLFNTFNMKWIFVGTVVLFEAGSALCGAAPTMSALIVGRVIAGAGGVAFTLDPCNTLRL
ncbi:Monooxygenase FAD-binding [Penicillium expansum]|nr:Monooxygenase FAD-binding [Penicillium expansum]